MAAVATKVVLVSLIAIFIAAGAYLRLAWWVYPATALAGLTIGFVIRLFARRKYPLGFNTRFAPAEHTDTAAEQAVDDAVLVSDERDDRSVLLRPTVPAFPPEPPQPPADPKESVGTGNSHVPLFAPIPSRERQRVTPSQGRRLDRRKAEREGNPQGQS